MSVGNTTAPQNVGITPFPPLRSAITGATLRSWRVQFRVPTAQLAAKLHRHPEVVLRWERRDAPVPRELADRYLDALTQCVAEGRTRP